jgi:hypothetical protein
MKMDQYSYIKLIKQFDQPTPIQIDNFINRLSFHHSWYKHLSEDRSHDFVIFLDPNVERTFRKITRKLATNNNLLLKEEFYCEFIDIEEDLDRSRYQNSYGFWKYFVTDGIPKPFNPIEENEGRLNSSPYLALNIVTDSGLITPIPDEIIKKCTIKLSRYIHDCFSHDCADGSYDREPPNIYIQKHEEIIKDLRNHMFSIVNEIYG